MRRAGHILGAATVEVRTDGTKIVFSGDLGRSQDALMNPPDRPPQADTVVIQYVKQTASEFFDKGGGNTPHAETIGSGKAVVLRDGLAFNATWSRPTAEDGTTYTAEHGIAIAFKPGQTWFVLLDRKRPASITPLKEPKPAPSQAPTSCRVPSWTRSP